MLRDDQYDLKQKQNFLNSQKSGGREESLLPNVNQSYLQLLMIVHIKGNKVKKQQEEFLHLSSLSGGVNQIPCHFSCRGSPKCRFRAAGLVTWGFGVPGCTGQAGPVRTQGAGAALTAGEETAGSPRGKGQGGMVGEGGREPGRERDSGALLEGQGRARGRKGSGAGRARRRKGQRTGMWGP